MICIVSQAQYVYSLDSPQILKYDPERFLNEAADLMYHYLVLLQAKGFSLKDVEAILKSRRK